MENSKSNDHIFASPVTGKPLYFLDHPLKLYNEEEEFNNDSGVFIFLPAPNSEYEGAYLNKIKYLPVKDYFPFTIPLWLTSNGYVWEVRKQFQKKALICELGCASGVNYFGERFNMAGLDFSYASLKRIENYIFKVQANALKLPFQNESLNGIISSYFWEHISPGDKEKMLKEFNRVLKPGGKVVMLFDIETQNRLIKLLKEDDLDKYEELFLRGDFHVGYETLEANYNKFKQAGFRVIKHFGMERTIFQSNSVYVKLSSLPTFYGKFARIMKYLTSKRIPGYLYILFLRIIDKTFGKLLKKEKSRIAISVLEK